MKKRYITLIDRTWKGKGWWSSFGGTYFYRMLTDEEAKSLDCIQEVIPLKPCEENVVNRESGRISCLKCKSTKGFFIHKMFRGKQINWYYIYKCADCGCREKKMYASNS